MSKDNIKQFPTVQEGPTEEEIQAQMERDEQELNGYLNKFKTIEQPDSSKVEVEDEEEEETITLDFTEDGLKAYEKEEETIIVPGGTLKLAEAAKGEDIFEAIKRVIEEKKEEEPRLKTKYNDFIQDLFVSKAIGSLIQHLGFTENSVALAVNEHRIGLLNYELERDFTETVYKKKQELREAIAGGRVHYDRIPNWAENYIDDYIRDAISGLTLLTERD